AVVSFLRWLLAIVLIGLVPLGAGAESTTTAAEIARLIRKLGSGDFDEREAAVKAVEATGPAAPPALAVATPHPHPPAPRRRLTRGDDRAAPLRTDHEPERPAPGGLA